MTKLPLTPEEVLTTTRSVRKRLDLERPVERDVVETCLRLAAREAVGRLAFLADGEIVVLPVNFTLRGSSVCFRSAVGSKVAAAVNHDTVTFEVDRYDLESQTGWSVLLKGTATSVTEEREILALEDTGVEPWLGATGRPYWIRIRPDVVTGRAVIRR